MAQLDDTEARRRLLLLGEVFRPSAPIADQDLFAGRNHQLMSVVEASSYVRGRNDAGDTGSRPR